MLARSLRSRGIVALGTLAIAACASASDTRRPYAGYSRTPSLTPTSRVLDAARIQRSGATTAWDAIRLLVPNYYFHSGRVSSLRTFSDRDARHFESSVRLIIDGHQLQDFEALRSIPAREVVAIHLLTAPEAMTYFGGGSGGGAIVVQTFPASRRP